MKRHNWAYSDLGHHWCQYDDSEYHDFPCDYPQEHINDDNETIDSCEQIFESNWKRVES